MQAYGEDGMIGCYVNTATGQQHYETDAFARYEANNTNCPPPVYLDMRKRGDVQFVLNPMGKTAGHEYKGWDHFSQKYTSIDQAAMKLPGLEDKFKCVHPATLLDALWKEKVEGESGQTMDAIKEKHDLDKRILEQHLLDLAKTGKPGTLTASGGVSCSDQLKLLEERESAATKERIELERTMLTLTELLGNHVGR
jgi:hypothetical protein